MKNSLSPLAFAWLAMMPQVHAAPVTIGDHSFEGNGLAAGGWSNDLGPEWLETGGPSSGAGFEEWISGFSAEGTEHLGTNSGHDVWQDLAVTYQANTRYTLTIAYGHRSGFTEAGNQTTYALADSTGTVFASTFIDASPLTAGSFSDAGGLIFDTTVNPLAVGNTVRILLQGRGPGRSHFDNIQLDAIAIEPPGTATLQNDPATAIAAGSATLRGQVNDVGDATPTVTIYYGDEDGGLTPGGWDQFLNLAGTHSGSFSGSVSGLSPATLYYFSARATNTAGDSWALSVGSFETLALPPTISNLAASNPGGSQRFQQWRRQSHRHHLLWTF